MKIQRFNISKPKKYTDRDGNERTQWNNIGILTVFEKEDGSVNRIIEIPAIGLQANIFPIEKRKEAEPPGTPAGQTSRTVPQPGEEEIDVRDIPF